MPKKPPSDFKTQLLAQRELLLAEVRARIAVSGESLGFAKQSELTDDDAAADAAAAMDVTMVIRESEDLQRIEAALARIAEGSYGNCVDCEGEIARARLKAYPMATRCLSCQEVYERLQQRAGKLTT